jgi:hypothetical protein
LNLKKFDKWLLCLRLRDLRWSARSSYFTQIEIGAIFTFYRRVMQCPPEGDLAIGEPTRGDCLASFQGASHGSSRAIFEWRPTASGRRSGPD